VTAALSQRRPAGGARVLLVSANRERQPFPVVPNGVACVASALEAAGHAVRVADLCFSRDPHSAARREVRAFRPDVIGVGVRNIDNSDYVALRHYTPDAAALLGSLRGAAPGAPVIAGGAAFGVAPESLLDALELEYAVAGDGERATGNLRLVGYRWDVAQSPSQHNKIQQVLLCHGNQFGK
jgi:hypothetical protein